MPRTARRLAAFLLAGATLMSLAACAPGGREPMPSPTAAQTDEPIFASDEEALAAAVAAYEAYSAASAVVGNEGGEGVERLQDTVAPDLYEQLVEEFTALRDANLRIVGEPAISDGSLAERSETQSIASVSAYFCRDVSPTAVVDASGTDVTPTSRDVIQPVLAHFVSKTESSQSLIVESMERWSDASFC